MANVIISADICNGRGLCYHIRYSGLSGASSPGVDFQTSPKWPFPGLCRHFACRRIPWSSFPRNALLRVFIVIRYISVKPFQIIVNKQVARFCLFSFFGLGTFSKVLPKRTFFLPFDHQKIVTIFVYVKVIAYLCSGLRLGPPPIPATYGRTLDNEPGTHEPGAANGKTTAKTNKTFFPALWVSKPGLLGGGSENRLFR